MRPLSVLIAGGILCGTYTDLAHAGSLYISEMANPSDVGYAGAGLVLNSSPTITYDRTARGGDAWAVPIGIGAGKMVKLGKLPVKLQREYDYYVVHPNDFGPRHLINSKITPVIPALIKKPLF